MNSESMFPHEKLHAYRQALDFHRWVATIKASIPRGLGEIYDQLLRASMSIVLNLAEGANTYSPGDKRKFFRIASGSAGECAAATDILAAHGLELAGLREARQHLRSAAALTVGLSRRL